MGGEGREVEVGVRLELVVVLFGDGDEALKAALLDLRVRHLCRTARCTPRCKS